MIQGSLLDEAPALPAPGTRLPALTLWQPWASLAALGIKAHETRSWEPPASLVGRRLAIHAGSGRPPAALVTPSLDALCVRTFGPDWRTTLPTGAILAVCTLSGSMRTEALRDRVHADDLTAGIWDDGRWAWRLDGLVRFDEPVTAAGAQGIWTWTVPDSAEHQSDVSL